MVRLCEAARPMRDEMIFSVLEYSIPNYTKETTKLYKTQRCNSPTYTRHRVKYEQFWEGKSTVKRANRDEILLPNLGTITQRQFK